MCTELYLGAEGGGKGQVWLMSDCRPCGESEYNSLQPSDFQSQLELFLEVGVL